MANQNHLLDVLQSHDAAERSILLPPPEVDACRNLILQLMPRHVWLRPAILRDHSFVGKRTIVNDLVNLLEFVFSALANHVPPRIGLEALSRQRRESQKRQLLS